jgi:hypothetical protein
MLQLTTSHYGNFQHEQINLDGLAIGVCCWVGFGSKRGQ